ncbi:MAG: hypothetical protein AAF557_00720 [Pseudomonadota bacterium]
MQLLLEICEFLTAVPQWIVALVALVALLGFVLWWIVRPIAWLVGALGVKSAARLAVWLWMTIFYSRRYEWSEIGKLIEEVRIPLVTATVIGLVLAFLGQPQEILLRMAEDLPLLTTSGDLIDLLSTTDAMSMYLLVLLELSIYAHTRFLLPDTPQLIGPMTTAQVKKARVREIGRNWLPQILAAIPLLGVLHGVKSIADSVPDDRVANTLNALVAVLFAAHAAVFFIIYRLLESHSWQWSRFWHWFNIAVRLIGYGATPILLVLFLFSQIDVPRFLGSFGLLVLFGVALVSALSGLTWLGQKLRFPIVTTFVVVGVGMSVTDWNDNHAITVQLPPALEDKENADQNFPNGALNLWSKYRLGVELTFPPIKTEDEVIVVAAQGGGLYAAYHTAMFLAHLQDKNPDTADRVFAVSGVSGGAVGAAVFQIIRRSGACSRDPAPSDSEGCHTRLTRSILRNDFLAPVLAAFLFPDLAARLVPGQLTEDVSRAKALERAFAKSLREVLLTERMEALKKSSETPLSPQELAEASDQVAYEVEAAINTHLLASWSPEPGGGPLLLLNATDVGTGQRMLLTRLLLLDGASAPDRRVVRTYAELAGCKTANDCVGPTLLTSALISARFPLVTPAATITFSQAQDQPEPLPVRTVRYVDGGYFENSGIETALDLIDQIAFYSSGMSVRLVVLDFPARTQAEADRERRRYLGELMSPIRAFLAARSARSALAQRRAAKLGESTGFNGRRLEYTPVSLDNRYADYTLGWSLSDRTFDRIECDLWQGEACTRVFDTNGSAESSKGTRRSDVHVNNKAAFATLLGVSE